MQKDEMKIETVSSTEVLSTIISTEIDMQIATAKKFPRDLTVALKKIEIIANLTPAISESCVYALPRKVWNEDKGVNETKILQGPSVRLAEIVTSQYGNIRSGARVINNDGRTITAQGFCHDLETNNFIAIEVKRKITTKKGKTYSEDMQIVTGNAACKIAYRNAVFTVIPAALVGDIYDKLVEKNKGKEIDLPQRRANAIEWFARKGVTIEQLFETLDIKTIEEIDLEKLQILQGMKASINNQEFTVEELFPPKEPGNKEDKKETGNDLADKTKDMIDEALNKGKKKNGDGKGTQTDLPLQ